MGIKNTIFALVAISGCYSSRDIPDTSTPEFYSASNVDVSETVTEISKLEPVSFDFETPSIELENITGLCEPLDERWDYPTESERSEIRAVIKNTCRHMGVGSEDCKFFYGVISARESSHRPWVRHKLPGDQAAALTAYFRTSHDYGWSVRWRPDSSGELSDIEYMEYGDSQNPYFTDATRWAYGLGLGGLNVSYHLSKFDSLAPPEILCDPVINTMVQITIARIAMHRYGASNFAEVQAIYAGRTVQDDNGSLIPLSCSSGCPKTASDSDRRRAKAGDSNVIKRCSTYGLDCYARPQLGSKINLESMPVSDRYKAAEEIRGFPLPDFDVPKEFVKK